jgi:hypothetical protein
MLGSPWDRFCKYLKQMRNSKSSEVMTHYSDDDISIAGTVYALLTVYVKVQNSQTSQCKLCQTPTSSIPNYTW